MFDQFAYTPMAPRDDGIDQMIVRFNTLDTSERSAVLSRPALGRFSVETKQVYQWNCAMMDKGCNEFSVPAMLVPAILGMEYSEAFHQRNFARDFLKVHGQEGVDWKNFKKNEMKFIMINDCHNEYKAPNAPDRVIRFSRDDHHNTRYPMVTPHFARVLMMRSTSQIGRELADFYTVVHDELRAYLRGKESALAPVIESATLKRARDQLEETKVLCEIKRIKGDAVLDHVKKMKELFGWDDGDRIYYKDVYRNTIKDDSPVEAVAIENDGRGGQISIAMICQQLGVNPRGASPAIGREMAKRWREANPGETIPKRETMYQGRPYMENIYYGKDKEMMEQVIRDVLNI